MNMSLSDIEWVRGLTPEHGEMIAYCLHLLQHAVNPREPHRNHIRIGLNQPDEIACMETMVRFGWVERGSKSEPQPRTKPTDFDYGGIQDYHITALGCLRAGVASRPKPIWANYVEGQQ